MLSSVTVSEEFVTRQWVTNESLCSISQNNKYLLKYILAPEAIHLFLTTFISASGYFFASELCRSTFMAMVDLYPHDGEWW